MVVYQFNCFCEDSYVGMTSRQFGKRIKEHIPKSIDEFCKTCSKKNKSIKSNKCILKRCHIIFLRIFCHFWTITSLKSLMCCKFNFKVFYSGIDSPKSDQVCAVKSPSLLNCLVTSSPWTCPFQNVTPPFLPRGRTMTGFP